MLIIKAGLIVVFLVGMYYLITSLMRQNKHESRKRDIEHQMVDIENENEINELVEQLEAMQTEDNLAETLSEENNNGQ